MEATKVTLSADRHTIEMAKRLARRKRTSMSAMFRKMIHDLADDETDDFDIEKLHPRTRALLGDRDLTGGKSNRELLEEALFEKHGIDK